MAKKPVLVVIAAVLVALGLYARYYFAPGQVIARSLNRAARAFEEEKILGAVKPIDRGYNDEYGLDFETIAGHMKAAMDSYDNLDVDLEILSISIKGKEAHTALRFNVTAASPNGREFLFGGPGEPCLGVLEWRKKDQGWFVVSSTDLVIPGHQEELQKRRGR